jgi:hypothetical protein
MIPLNDVADGIGIDRSGLRQLLKRNERVLSEYVGKVMIPSPSGEQETVCLSRDGITGILMKMDISRMKDPQKRDKVIIFQKWAIETLSKIVKGETIPIPRDDAVEAIIRSHLDIADAMVQYAHVDRGIMTTVALAKVENETGVDLSWLKGLVRKDRQQPPGYLNAGQVGEELGGWSAHSVNKVLAQLGYQYWIGGRWQPTQIGMNYGENVPFTVINRNGSSHSDYQLRWSPEMVRKIRDHIDGTAQIQTRLGQ